MKKFLYTGIILLLFSFSTTNAQSVADAEKLIRYERFVSARQLLEKITTQNPADAMAWYWLGQTWLLQPDPSVEKAKAVFQNGWKAIPEAPALNAGLGHIDLREKHPDAAKLKFTSALQKSNNDPAIVKAIARANMDGQFYGPGFNGKDFNQNVITPLEKLPLSDGEACLLLARAWRIQKDVSKTLQYFDEAQKIPDWKAAANYQLAITSMTMTDKEIPLNYLEKTVAADPAFAPAWLQMHLLYNLRDFEKAQNCLDRYLATSDPDCKMELYYPRFLSVNEHYQEALNRLDQLAKGNCKDSAFIHFLRAEVFFKQKNYSAASTSIDQYLTLQKKERIRADEYEYAGLIYQEIPGQEKKAYALFETAADSYTDESARFIALTKILTLARKIKDWEAAFHAAGRKYGLTKNPANVVLYDYAQEAYNAGHYKTSDSLYTIYINKYPDQTFGYFGRGNARAQLDPDMSKGLAVADYENFVKIAGTDKTKYKNQLLRVYGYLGSYFVNIKKDKINGLKYLNEFLTLDPANEPVKKAIQQLQQ